jgi:hypothetical protein
MQIHREQIFIPINLGFECMHLNYILLAEYAQHTHTYIIIKPEKKTSEQTKCYMLFFYQFLMLVI